MKGLIVDSLREIKIVLGLVSKIVISDLDGSTIRMSERGAIKRR